MNLPKNQGKLSIHALLVDFVQKIGYYAVGNYNIIVYTERRCIHE